MTSRRICVDIKTDGQTCSPECPYFSLKPGASFERPFVERCSVFKADLRIDRGGSPVRCPECFERDALFRRDSLRIAMEESCMDKKAALKLLRDTGYKTDIYSYAGPAELMDALLNILGLSREYVKNMLEVDDDHLDMLIRGVGHQYVIAPLKEKLGFPKPPPMDSETLRNYRAATTRDSR